MAIRCLGNSGAGIGVTITAALRSSNGMRGLIVALAVIGCGGPAAPRPLVVYRNAADAFELRLSATGGMAAMVIFLDYGKYEIRL